MLVELTLVAILLTYGAIALCRTGGLVDRPDQRKRHGAPVPLAGGIAIFATFFYATLKLQLAPYSYPMLLVIGAIFLLGMVDDRVQVRPALRLALQYGAGIIMATWAGIAIHKVGNLLAMGDIPLLLLTVPLTALSFAGLANAYNMIDGIDGLAAATVVLPLGVLLVLAYSGGHPMTPTLTAILLPLGVFLCFNLGPDTRAIPRIFLGDAGSVTLGFLVCASLVYFSQGDEPLIQPVTALWLVTVPLMDMLATMLRRARRGSSPLLADRLHLHHSLMDMGLGPRETTVLLAGYGGLCAVIGLGLEAIPAYLSLLLYTLLFGAHCLFVLRSESIGPVVRKLLQRPLVNEQDSI